jgi:hypothetical protein
MNDVEQIIERLEGYVVVVIQIMHQRLHIRTISCHGAAKGGKRQDEDQGRDHEDHCGFSAQSTPTAEVSHKARDAVYRDFVVDKHRPEGIERDRFRLHTCGHVCAEHSPRQSNELSVVVLKSDSVLSSTHSAKSACPPLPTTSRDVNCSPQVWECRTYNIPANVDYFRGRECKLAETQRDLEYTRRRPELIYDDAKLAQFTKSFAVAKEWHYARNLFSSVHEPDNT